MRIIIFRTFVFFGNCIYILSRWLREKAVPAIDRLANRWDKHQAT